MGVWCRRSLPSFARRGVVEAQAGLRRHCLCSSVRRRGPLKYKLSGFWNERFGPLREIVTNRYLVISVIHRKICKIQSRRLLFLCLSRGTLIHLYCLAFPAIPPPFCSPPSPFSSKSYLASSSEFSILSPFSISPPSAHSPP